MFKKIALTALIILFLSSLVVQASNISIYLRNQPYKGDYFIKEGSLYIPLDDFLKDMCFTWKKEGNLLYILPSNINFEYSPIEEIDLTYSYKNKKFKSPFLIKNGVNYIKVRDMAEKLEAMCIYNPQTRIIDIVMPAVSAGEILKAAEGKVVSKKDKKEGESKTETGKVTSETPESEPIKTKVDYFQDYDPNNQAAGGDVRGTVTINNTSEEEVKNVVVTLHLQDMAGQDLHKEIWRLGDMEAGAKLQKPFHWSNPNPFLAFKPKVEVKHD